LRVSAPLIAPGDQTAAMLADPYRFIARRCHELGADAFETRLLLKRTVCMRGREAAELFYDPERFSRDGAMPSPVRKTLLGEGGVQSLDGEPHRKRKAVFLALTDPERVRVLGDLFEAEFLKAAEQWEASQRDHVVLYDELHLPLTRAVCAWAGVPLPAADAKRRASQLRALFDAAGSLSPRHLKARLCRKIVDRWLAGVVEDVREGRIRPESDSPVYAVATCTDTDGRLLSPRIAGVELANLLRPTVATAVYVTFLAHALATHPDMAVRATADRRFRRAFVEEVRRIYPFFPSVVARARTDFAWNGVTFSKGGQAVLDLYGTDHDPSAWPDHARFDPERFLQDVDRRFSFIPQGGGDHATGHRCPGEGVVVELLERSVDLLTTRLVYTVPEQDLSIDFGRLPALPKSGFVMSHVEVLASDARVSPKRP
jgi:fatty-acid peroxygenase